MKVKIRYEGGEWLAYIGSVLGRGKTPIIAFNNLMSCMEELGMGEELCISR